MINTLQARLVFGRPTRIRPLAPGPHAGSYVTTRQRLACPDGAVLEGWSAQPAEGPPEGVVLYFGGRNENVAWATDMASFLPGHAVHAFNYRGFGASTGRSSERRAKLDARAILRHVAGDTPPANFTLVGRSLGTALALSLAQATTPDRLVLMAPFESVAEVLRTRPLGWALAALLTQRFDCGNLAAGYAGRVLVLLAATDAVVPHEQSLRLCARLPNLPTVEVVAGSTHQSLPRSAGAQAAIARFLAGRGQPAGARATSDA